MVLQCTQETQDKNDNHHCEGNGNSIGETPITNPCYRGLSKFGKDTATLFHGDYNLVLAGKMGHAAREDLYSHGMCIFTKGDLGYLYIRRIGRTLVKRCQKYVIV